MRLPRQGTVASLSLVWLHQQQEVPAPLGQPLCRGMSPRCPTDRFLLSKQGRGGFAGCRRGAEMFTAAFKSFFPPPCCFLLGCAVASGSLCEESKLAPSLGTDCPGSTRGSALTRGQSSCLLFATPPLLAAHHSLFKAPPWCSQLVITACLI